MYREYGTSVIHPNIDGRHTDAVVIFGGNDAGGATETVAICKGTATASGSFDATPQGYDWKPLPSMAHKRTNLNVVGFPDASFVVFGGENSLPVLQAERYIGGVWQPMATMVAPRLYHSTALFVPNGDVVVAAGENRGWDYEVFSSTYMHGCLPRPSWGEGYPAETLFYGTTYDAKVSIATGGTVQRVVLMRPGSVTHHFDSDQRYVQLVTEPGSEQVTFTTPSSRALAQPGFWMIFVVSNLNQPSEARWVELR